MLSSSNTFSSFCCFLTLTWLKKRRGALICASLWGLVDCDGFAIAVNVLCGKRCVEPHKQERQGQCCRNFNRWTDNWLNQERILMVPSEYTWAFMLSHTFKNSQASACVQMRGCVILIMVISGACESLKIVAILNEILLSVEMTITNVTS